MLEYQVVAALAFPVAILAVAVYWASPRGSIARLWCYLMHSGHQWRTHLDGWGRTCDRCKYMESWR